MDNIYRENDVGCWIDSSFGIDHACYKLCQMLEPLKEHEAKIVGYQDDLQDYDEEWIGEAMDKATDILQSYTEDGFVWEWYEGALILTKEE